MPSDSVKIMSDSYLYNKSDYSKQIYEFLMTHQVINKNSQEFDDILYQVKVRQTSPIITKVLMSDKVVLCLPNKALPRAFKVIRAKDPRSKTANRKIYIDCSECIVYKDGVYRLKSIAHLISYVITAMSYIIYYIKPELITRNVDLTKAGSEAFVDLSLYILGFLKAPITVGDNKESMSYILAVYYQLCILGKTEFNTALNMGKKISKIDDKKAQYLDILFSELFQNKDIPINKVSIDDFIALFAKVFMNQDKTYSGPDRLNSDVFVSRWMYSFGPGTYLGLELFCPFSSIITDTYVGGYINQQNTIEKIVSRNVIEFSTTLLKIGSDNA